MILYSSWLTNGCVAQLARAFGSYPTGRWFESVRSHQHRSLWPHGQVAKTPPFHGGIMGSNPVGVTKKSSCVLRGVFFYYAWKMYFISHHTQYNCHNWQAEKPEEEKIYTLNGHYYIQTIDDIFFITKIEDWLCPLNNYVKAQGLARTNSPRSYISRQEQSEIGNKVYASRPNIFSFWLNSILNLCKSNIKRSRFFVCSFCFLVSIISPWTHKRRRFLCLIVCTILFQRLSPTKHAPHKETRPSGNRIHSMFSFYVSP